MEVEASAKEIIERAITALQTKGWCQGALEDFTTGQMCMLGALGMKPSDGYWGMKAPERAALVAVAETVYDYPMPGAWVAASRISRWNDQPGRTIEQVIEIFQKALEGI